MQCVQVCEPVASVELVALVVVRKQEELVGKVVEVGEHNTVAAAAVAAVVAAAAVAALDNPQQHAHLFLFP